MKQRILITMLIAVMAAVGCSKGDTPDTHELPYELSDTEIGFGAEESITKGTPVTAFSDGDSFGVYAIYTNGETKSTYMDNQEVSCYGTTWSYSPTMYWPVSGSLSFYAYSPYLGNNGSGTSFSYTTPSSAADNVDLLVATPITGKTIADASSAIEFSFKHVFSKVGFSFTNNDPTYLIGVNSVTIDNIIKSGTINLTSAEAIASTTSGYITACNTDGTLETDMVPVNTTTDITTDDGYLFLYPQATSEISITVSISRYVEDSTSVAEETSTISCNYTLTGGFVAGQHYTFILEYTPSDGAESSQ